MGTLNMKTKFAIVGALVGLTALVPYTAFSQSKKESGSKVPEHFKPFQLDKFLAIESESQFVRVEDLKVSQQTKNTARAVVNIKNVSDNKIQVGVHLALFDANLRLVASGNYITTPLFGGYKARETSTEGISLGNVGDISKAKYYQTRVVAYIDQ